MNILRKLLRDETGLVMSAETVMLGTVGVLGVVAGVGAMSSAVNDEMGELGMAFRSFDQSYSVAGTQVAMGGSSGGGRRTGGAYASKTGSGFQQESTQKAVERVRMQMVRNEATVEQMVENTKLLGGQAEIVIEEREVSKADAAGTNARELQGREIQYAIEF